MQNNIVFDNLLLDDLCSLQLKKYSSLVVITDNNLFETSYFKNFIKKLSTQKIIYTQVIKPGEHSKIYNVKMQIEHEMLRLGLRKSVAIIAIGGGVVLDLAGFIAATYCRGVDWFAIPTSLMAMVDVSVGGKTGINTKYGKNTIGAIYPPVVSYIDLNWLNSLSFDEYRWALPEVVKISLIQDAAFFNWLNINANSILQKKTSVINNMIQQAVALKLQLVNQDLYDVSLRQFLNFGHTLGHSLEIWSNWQITHGQAVAYGLLFATRLSKHYQNIDGYQLVKQALLNLNCNFDLPININKEQLWQLCFMDKKQCSLGNVNWIGLNKIGQACFLPQVTKDVFLQYLY